MKQWNKVYKDKVDSYKYYNVLSPHEDLKDVEKVFKEHKVEKILDLGCGIGRNLIPLVKNGYELFGIDIAEEGVNKLRGILKEQKLKADLKVGNILKKLPYEDNFFDAVISVQVLQHGTENQILKTIKEIKRTLKPGGLVFITLCGRIAKGEVRYCLVKTAELIAPHTYVPTQGDEKGLTHFIYNKNLIKKHYKDFEFLEEWKDTRDYYCFIGQLNKFDKEINL